MKGTLSNWFEIRSGSSQATGKSLFLPPMDWVLERIAHKGFLGVTLGDEVFTDLDFIYVFPVWRPLYWIFLCIPTLTTKTSESTILRNRWYIQLVNSVPSKMVRVSVFWPQSWICDSVSIVRRFDSPIFN